MISTLKRGLELYLSSIILYCLGVIIILHGPYYPEVLTEQAKRAIVYLFSGYILLAPIYYLITVSKYSENKPFLIFKSINRNIKNLVTKGKRIGLLKEEKVAFLFIIVKLFYLPLMINFFLNNLNSFQFQLGEQINYYALILTIIFTIDTGIFAFGYSFEFKTLKNIVKSVEPTFFGWFVALICYPPFNTLVVNNIPWGSNDYAIFSSELYTSIARIFIVLLLVIYLWASVALGPKASNLTNRGIVTKFPYSIVRHPAYISKNIVWWLTLIPIINWKLAGGLLLWTIIYYFRAITEERHLKADSDYVKYCKKVKWKFIPGVY